MASDVQARVAQFTTPTALGAVVHAVDCDGQTPKAVLIFHNSHNPVDAADTAHAVACIAATDGTRHRYSGASSQNGVRPTNCYSWQGNNHLIRQVNPASGVNLIVGDFVSFEADGIEINYTAVDSVAHDGFIVAFYGADLQAYCDDTGLLGSGAGTAVLTSLPFKADWLFMFGSQNAVSASDLVSNWYAFSMGMAAPNAPLGGDTGMVHGQTEGDNSTGGTNDAGRPALHSSPSDMIMVNTTFGWTGPGTPGQTWTAIVHNFADVGFSITKSANFQDSAWPFLALKTGDKEHLLYEMTSPGGGVFGGSTGLQDPFYGRYSDRQTHFVFNLSSSADLPQGYNDFLLSVSIGAGATDSQGNRWACAVRICHGGGDAHNETSTGSAVVNDSILVYTQHPIMAQATIADVEVLDWAPNWSVISQISSGNMNYYWTMYDPVGPIVEATIGGSGCQLEPIGCVLRAQPYALEVRDLNSVVELGPFRFVEQKESDETSMVSTLVLGLTEVDTGLLVEVDMALLSDTVDMATLVDILGDDIYIDMGEGIGNSDDFTLELLGNDDGSTYPGPPIEFKPEVLSPIEDRGSTKQYSPEGKSFLYHRVRLKATEIDQKFGVKFVDLSGQLTGRLF